MGEAARQRLIEVLQNGAAPQPLIRAERSHSPAISVLLLALGVFAIVVVGTLGFGALDGGEALQPMKFAGLYGTASGLILIGVLGLWRLRHRTSLPDGRFLFPGELIELRRNRLHITLIYTAKTDELRERRLQSSYLRTDIVLAWLDGHEVAIPVEGDKEARRIRGVLASARQRLGSKGTPSAVTGIEQLLVFPPGLPLRQRSSRTVDSGPYRSQQVWSDVVESSEASRARGGILALAFVAASFVLGLGILHIRNGWSDEKSYRQAMDRGHASDLALYARGGGAHAKLVRSELLPEADFEAAKKSGSIAALRAFITEYPDAPLAAAARDLISEIHGSARRDASALTANHPALQRYILRLISLAEMRRIAVPRPGVLRAHGFESCTHRTCQRP